MLDTIGDEITKELVHLSFFVNIGKAIVKSKTIEATLHEIMIQIGHVFTPFNWSLLLKNSKTGNLTFTIVIGQSADKLRGLQIPKGEGVAGWISETGQALIIEDVQKDSRFSDRVDRYTGFVTKSIIGVPLKSNGKVFGVIELINKLDGELFSPYDLKILTTIADFSAIAIEKAYYYKALRRLAAVDALTGVYNRGYFDRSYIKELDICRRYGNPLSLMMLDINKFKQINDAHGHPAGDSVLKRAAGLISECVRKVDIVCRFGGDEFVVLMPNTTKKKAEILKKRILDRIDYQNSLNPEIPYTVSIGVHAVDIDNHEQTLQLLDSDMYREKGRKQMKNYEKMGDNIEDLLAEEKNAKRPPTPPNG